MDLQYMCMYMYLHMHTTFSLCLLPSSSRLLFSLLSSSLSLLVCICTCTVAVSGAAQIIGDLVTGRVAETRGQSVSIPFNERDGAGKFNFIADVLRWRAQTNPENQLFSLVDTKVCSTMYMYIHVYTCSSAYRIAY